MNLPPPRPAWGLVLFLSACGGAPVEVAPPVDDTTAASCDRSIVVDPGELLAALGEAAPPSAEGEAPRAFAAQLDGEGPTEAVLVLRTAGDTFGDHGHVEDGQGATDHVWAFTRSGDGWTPIGHDTFDATGDYGTYEYTPGVRRVEARPLLGECHDVVYVEVEQAQGSVDPRWFDQRMVLLGLQRGELERLFECATVREDVSGPARAGYVTRREVVFGDARPLIVSVTATRSYDPGFVDEEDEAEDEDEEEVTSAEYRLTAEGLEVCR